MEYIKMIALNVGHFESAIVDEKNVSLENYDEELILFKVKNNKQNVMILTTKSDYDT